MKSIFYTLTLAVCVSAGTVFAAADGQKTLVVNTMKFVMRIPFSDASTIAEIKYVIQDKEGLPADSIVLYKNEWVRPGLLLPEKCRIELENNRTCAEYDLQNQSEITCYLQIRRRASH
jgi:hypothetical protein